VRLLAERASDGRVSVHVSDSGPGIAEAERKRVFEEFYQVGNPSRDRSQGLGLGLAIVERTARLLDIPLSWSASRGAGRVSS
jgi:signal transduction histidine kinase